MKITTPEQAAEILEHSVFNKIYFEGDDVVIETKFEVLVIDPKGGVASYNLPYNLSPYTA